MKKNVVVTAAAALVAALAAGPALAQEQAKTGFDPNVGLHPTPAGVLVPGQQTPATPAQAPQTQAPLPGVAPVTTAQSHPFVTPGPRVDLTIEDAVKRARQNNIDIGVARITPRLTDFTIAGLQASYNVNLTAATNSQETNRFPTQTIQGISNVTPTFTEGWSSGLAKSMWRGGGNWTLNFTNTRQNQPSTVNLRNPTFSSGLAGSYVQPLLRGFKIDSNRAALMTDRISQQNDEISLQTTIETTDANTRNAYWDLVYAIQAVEAAQNSLDIASTLVHQNQQRVEIGTLAPIDIKSAQAEEANAKLTLVQAEATVRTDELALKRLIVAGTDDPLWTSSLNPVDRPGVTAEALNVEAATARALQQRTDLQQSLNNLKISDINLRAQSDLVKPQLNLTATYGLNGIGGTQFVKDQTTGLTTTVPSGYFDALSTLGGFNAPQWNLSLSFAYPLGVSAQESNVARSKLSLEQSQANLKALQLQIATDVQNAALNVQSSLESVQASQTARELSKEKLDAAQSKMEVGMATNYDVIQAQRDFAEAQNAELRAIANYRKALVAFETAQTVGTRGVSAGVGSTGGGGGTTGATSSGSTGSGGSSTGGSSSGGSGGGGL